MNGHSEVSFVPTDDICVIHLHQNGIGVENVALKVNQVDVKIADFTINSEYEYLSVRATKSLFLRSILIQCIVFILYQLELQKSQKIFKYYYVIKITLCNLVLKI